MTGIVDDLAQHIRQVDGDNKMDPHKLGNEVAAFLIDRALLYEDQEAAVPDFVAASNPRKHVGAGQLAELIVDEFGLEDQ